jgi:hypothetical protein
MALGPAYKDIEYYSGDELKKAYTVLKDGSPVNMLGDTLLMHVKRKRTDLTSKAFAVLSSDVGTIVVSGANNNIYTLSGQYALDQDTYYYDIERVNVNETTQYGKFLVTGDVTRV